MELTGLFGDISPGGRLGKGGVEWNSELMELADRYHPGSINLIEGISRACPSSGFQPESYQCHCLPLPPELVPVVVSSPKVAKALASRCLLSLPW